MALHALRDQHRQPWPARRNGLIQLGWTHFWVLAVILGWLVTLVGFVLYARLSSV
jgi:hypothetical protein